MTISNTSKSTAAAIVNGIVGAMNDIGIPVQPSQLAELQLRFAEMVQNAINSELYGIADPCECGEPHWRN